MLTTMEATDGKGQGWGGGRTGRLPRVRVVLEKERTHTFQPSVR